MRRIFISSLGTGDYKPCVYKWRGPTPKPGTVASATRYVQRAIVELFGEPAFDKCILLVTPESRERHADALTEELRQVVPFDRIALREISSAVEDVSQQWRWFEALLREVKCGDRLVIDMTHGFRAVPIVLSAALGYLQRTKGVVLEHVLYGAHDKDGVIVDMRDFYVVQEWADAVGRLVDNADATKLAALAANAPKDSTFARLSDPKLADALKQLTANLRNVDVHQFASATQRALEVVGAQASAPGVTDAERQLLEMVREKFVALVTEPPSGDRYDLAYLEVQLVAAEKLVEHGLHMQAFTVLSELIGSIGMLGLIGTKRDFKMTTSDGRDERGHADIFKRMIANDRAKWNFKDCEKSKVERLQPWFDALAPVLPRLKELSDSISKVRNGFNHGWTSKRIETIVPGKDSDEALRAEGKRIVAELREEILRRLPENPHGST